MFQASSHPYVQFPAPASAVTPKATSPVCPECGSSLNRVPRRFIDRLISLVYPVHRYHCRSFDCNWEGNVRYLATEADHWEPLDAYSDAPSGAKTRDKDRSPPAIATEPRATEPPRREGDTLPLPPTPSSKTPNARANSRDATKAPRRAKKRT